MTPEVRIRLSNRTVPRGESRKLDKGRGVT